MRDDICGILLTMNQAKTQKSEVITPTPIAVNDETIQPSDDGSKIDSKVDQVLRMYNDSVHENQIATSAAIQRGISEIISGTMREDAKSAILQRKSKIHQHWGTAM